jgi:transcriptional regulator with AAA-type ATPase domain
MTTALFKPAERAFAEIVSELCYTNPFGKQRVDLEKRALGDRYSAVSDAWSLGPGHHNKNLLPLTESTRALLVSSQRRISAHTSADDRMLFGGLLRFYLFYRFNDDLLALTGQSLRPGFKDQRVALHAKFRAAWSEFRPDCDVGLPEPGHLFALLFQLRRAFERIHQTIIGASGPARALRARLWQSVFSHDMRRYERTLFDRMHEMPTLILGPSGTGKELAARAIGLSRYLPFNEKTESFVEEVADSFQALNIAALAPELLESELFGHAKGAFTGAGSDRVGWLEGCSEHGTIFLDEIGELDGAIQIKLLRTLQTRELQRVGESKTRPFSGKVISATNRNLDEAIENGTFRQDFYYRLCADIVHTPTLAAQLKDRPGDLDMLVSHVVARLVNADEIEAVTEQVSTFVRKKLGMDYPWPGNIRELEQCARNVLIQGEYTSQAQHAGDEGDAGRSMAGKLSRAFLAGEISADELLDTYTSWVFQKTQSYSETGRKLGLDRRTVKSRVNPALLRRFR